MKCTFSELVSLELSQCPNCKGWNLHMASTRELYEGIKFIFDKRYWHCDDCDTTGAGFIYEEDNRQAAHHGLESKHLAADIIAKLVGYQLKGIPLGPQTIGYKHSMDIIGRDPKSGGYCLGPDGNIWHTQQKTL